MPSADARASQKRKRRKKHRRSQAAEEPKGEEENPLKDELGRIDTELEICETGPNDEAIVDESVVAVETSTEVPDDSETKDVFEPEESTPSGEATSSSSLAAESEIVDIESPTSDPTFTDEISEKTDPTTVEANEEGKEEGEEQTPDLSNAENDFTKPDKNAISIVEELGDVHEDEPSDKPADTTDTNEEAVVESEDPEEEVWPAEESTHGNDNMDEQSEKLASQVVQKPEVNQIPDVEDKTVQEASLLIAPTNDVHVDPEAERDPAEMTIVVADTLSLLTCEDDSSDITVSVVTWNLAELAVVEEETSFLKKFRKTPSCGDSENGSDIVLISGQECENIKPRRTEGHRSKEYRRLMVKMLGKNYVPLAIHSLGGIQFGLFCKRSILSDVEFCSVADVTCGIGNVFHNKGAVAAFLKLKARDRSSNTDGPQRAQSVKMLFVASHMAAHVKNTDARNMDYWRIASELEAQAPPQFLQPKNQDSPPKAGEERKDGSGTYLMESVDRAFFCGDLNYRLDVPREVAEFTVSEMKRLLSLGDKEATQQAEKLRLELIRHDQLHQAIAESAAFPGFSEGKINFPPTFKFDKGTKDYDTSHKQRIPAWTDRVLFKPFGVRVLEYTSEENSMHSDHRPVHATFRVSMQARELPQGSKKTRTRVSRKTSKRSPKD